jgi:hypothetical protein
MPFFNPNEMDNNEMRDLRAELGGGGVDSAEGVGGVRRRRRIEAESGRLRMRGGRCEQEKEVKRVDNLVTDDS